MGWGLDWGARVAMLQTNRNPYLPSNKDPRERNRRARGDMRPGAAKDLQGRLQTGAVPRPGAGVQRRPEGGVLVRRQGDQVGRETHRDEGDERGHFKRYKIFNHLPLL